MIFDPILESRLYEWAGWHLDLQSGDIGYPKQSSIMQIIEVGISTPTFGPREPDLNPRAMEVNLWVVRMSHDFPTYAKALRDYYFNRNMPLRAIAQANKISISTLKARVHDAKVWLSGRFSAIYKDECGSMVS